MGVIVHHAIVIVGGSERHYPTIHDAHDAAIAVGCTVVTPVAGPGVNGTCSFMVGPDGGKEDRHYSDLGDEARNRFVTWLRNRSCWFTWAEVELDTEAPCVRVSRSIYEDDEED